MPYFGRAPTGTGAANKIEGDLKVTGTISGESINGKMGLDATDGSASNLDDHITIEDGGTDGSGTNAGDDLLLEDITLTTPKGQYVEDQGFVMTTLTDAATIQWDLTKNQVTTVTLGGNRVLAAPTGQRAGSTYVLITKQDSSGSRTLNTTDPTYKFPGGTSPTLSTGANAVDVLTFVSDGTSMFGVSQLNFS
tara:strand:+ start:28 stop:606 length:579 start_codon:yes stop_codon:yes gene_type:complete